MHFMLNLRARRHHNVSLLLHDRQERSERIFGEKGWLLVLRPASWRQRTTVLFYDCSGRALLGSLIYYCPSPSSSTLRYCSGRPCCIHDRRCRGVSGVARVEAGRATRYTHPSRHSSPPVSCPSSARSLRWRRRRSSSREVNQRS